jgi:hypothetical protein
MKTETLDGSSAVLEVSNEETGGIPRRDSMKNKEIRNYILGQDEDHMCVRIKRNGEIHVRTKSRRRRAVESEEGPGLVRLPTPWPSIVCTVAGGGSKEEFNRVRALVLHAE